MSAAPPPRISAVLSTLKQAVILLALLACVSPPASSRQAEGGDVLARAGDEAATTTDEKQRALSILLAAAERARGAGETLEAARYMNRAGRLQLRLNLPHDALSTYTQALSTLNQAADAPTKVDGLNGVGTAYIDLVKCDRAQSSFRQAIALSEQNGYVAGKAEALLYLSSCQNFSNHGLALETAQESLELWQSINHKWGTAKAYAAVGEYQFSQNELMAAAESYEAALSIWRELNLPDEQADALINLGFIEYRKGAWQNSMSFLTRAQDLLGEKPDPYKMGQITAGIAEAFIESGMPEAGLEKLQQASVYFQQAQRKHAVMVMTWDIGKTYYFLGDYAAAASNLQASLAEGEVIREPAITAMSHEYLGRTYVAMGDRAAALGHYEAAVDLYLKVGDRMEAGRTKALMAQLYQQEGKVEKARTFYQSALAAFRTLTDHVNESAALYALGSLELGQGNLDPAEELLRKSIEATENIRRVSKSSDLTAAFSANVYERYEKYIECLMRRGGGQPTRELSIRAFETSELARGRSLAELLRATETNLAPGIDPQLAGQEKSLRQALRVKEDYKVALLSRAYKKEDLDALEADTARLEGEYGRVVETIRARYPSYAEMSEPAGWGLRRIQEQVVADDQTVLLEYSLGEDKSYAWAVTRDGIESFELPARSAIDGAAQKVYRLLSADPSRDVDVELSAATRELGRLILSPVSAHPDKRRIIVVADGTLNYIPFQILPVAGDEPLVARYEVVNAPSASILGQLRQEAARRQPAAKLLAAFGDPVFASNYAQRAGGEAGALLASARPVEAGRWRPGLRNIELNADAFDPSIIKPLFYATRELANLRDVAGAGESLVAPDFAATREQLLRTDLTRYAIIHFATHGLLDPKRPENSGLVLSTVDREGREQNGFVGLKDIYALRAPVDLVVLSACQTALGKDVRGEGLIGLTRGFMYAGASTVVASLWKVDDEATAELMKQFYVNMLRRGLPPAAALREAQNVIRQRPEWSSPHYWAAFTLQGEYREVIRPPRDSLIVSAYGALEWATAVLMLAGGAAWLYRRRKLKPGRAEDSYSTVKK
jgi:CHAT domain-containing protein/Tfp pilus assembly protein PilF